jgi:carboxylesterase
VSEQIMDGAEPTFAFGEQHAGLVLVHDLAGTPQIFHEMAERIAEQGFSVDVPLLPGHGTDLNDLDETTWDDWAAAAQLALDELASRAGAVVLCGIGMGATLATFVGAQHPSVAGVIAINPRAMPVPSGAIEMLQAMIADGCETVPPLGPDVSDRGARVVEYQTVPVRTLISMFDALDDLQGHWGAVTSPTLVVTSARDHRVSPYEGDWLADRLGGTVERLTLPNSFHLAPVDVDKEMLEQAIVEFSRRHTSL